LVWVLSLLWLLQLLQLRRFVVGISHEEPQRQWCATPGRCEGSPYLTTQGCANRTRTVFDVG
jgi:hypothetical protein